MSFLSVVHEALPIESADALSRDGFFVHRIKPVPSLDERIAGHPDLQLFPYNGTVFAHKDLDTESKTVIAQYGNLVICDRSIRSPYPDDSPFNIALAGNTAFCRKDLIPREISDAFNRDGINVVHVNQGYSRCSIIPLNENSIITEDDAIARTAEKRGFTVLRIARGKVTLPGFPYGFLGGCTGVTDSSVYFTGVLDQTPEKSAIYGFISSTGKSVVFLSSDPLIDFGSILFL